MSAPVSTDLVIYPGASATPTDDTSAYGGAITTTSPMDDTVLGVDLATIFLSASNVDYHAIFYFQNNCTTPGTLNAARVYNRSGARVNTSSGVCQYVSTSILDNGKVITTGKVSGVFTQETITLTGTTPVSGAVTWDANSVLRHEFLNSSNTPTANTGNITISCAGQILAVGYGTADSSSLSTIWCSAEVKFALASAKGTTISGTGRINPPGSGIGSFGYATYWAGEDNSLGVPGGALGFGEYIGVCVKFTAYTGIPIPVSNLIDHFPVILGTPA